MSKSVWEIFNEECPEVSDAYIKLSSAINKDNVLDEKTRNLILIGIYSTTRDFVALRHFTRLAFNFGALDNPDIPRDVAIYKLRKTDYDTKIAQLTENKTPLQKRRRKTASQEIGGRGGHTIRI